MEPWNLIIDKKIEKLRHIFTFLKKKNLNFPIILFSIFYLLSSVLFSGCATARRDTLSDFPEPDKKGIYHKVGRGETLWRIAKTYDVSIGDIVRSNRIPNAAQIEENQLIFVPDADALKEVVVEKSGSQADFMWPLRGKVLRYFHEEWGGGRNKGIHIQVTGQEEVKAARTGHVVFADHLSGYGPTVILDHGDGFYSVYAQNSKILVKSGDFVLKNSNISQIEAKDRLAYLHFEIRRNVVEDNPLYYLP